MNLPDSGRHVTRVNQGLFSTTMEAEKRDPGNEVAASVAVTEAFRINKSANLISESGMTDGSAFLIANVKKHFLKK